MVQWPVSCSSRVSFSEEPSEGSRGPTAVAVSLDSALQEQLYEKLKEENAALLAKLEQLEHRKNEEMQNLKTSLIAEQQVGSQHLHEGSEKGKHQCSCSL